VVTEIPSGQLEADPRATRFRLLPSPAVQVDLTAVLSNVAAKLSLMTLPGCGYEVGVRDLHDRLSEHLERVQEGGEIVVTRRGRPIARLSAIDADDPLDELVRQGLVTVPKALRGPARPRVEATGAVSDLVADQRR